MEILHTFFSCKESFEISPFSLAREFLELDAELPKSNQTAALSGKNVMKMISKVGDLVWKLISEAYSGWGTLFGSKS